MHGYQGHKLKPNNDNQQTTSQYLKQHKISASNRSPGKYHGYAYDGVWAVALAIHALLRGRGGSPPIEEEMFRGERFRALLNNTDFVGVTVSYSDMYYFIITTFMIKY